MKPIHNFLIGVQCTRPDWPRKWRRFAVEVFIWSSVNDIRREWGEGSKTAIAFWRGVNRRHEQRHGCLIAGELHIPKSKLGGGLVGHEIFHATMHMAKLAGWRTIGFEREETLALLHERITKDFWNITLAKKNAHLYKGANK